MCVRESRSSIQMVPFSLAVFHIGMLRGLFNRRSASDLARRTDLNGTPAPEVRKIHVDSATPTHQAPLDFSRGLRVVVVPYVSSILYRLTFNVKQYTLRL